MKRKYKVFDYCWHTPHQYDMLYALREDCDFYYCVNFKTDWDFSKRPKPGNLTFVPFYEPGLYDVAILHIDQSSVISGPKRDIFLQFDDVIRDIPKIVLNHGSPVFPEAYEYRHLSRTEAEETCRKAIRDLVGKNIMVVNSYAASSDKEWGFGVPIVHGMNPEDWWDLPKEPRVFTALSPIGMHEYYNRGCMIELADILAERYGYPLSYAKLNVNTDRSFEDYKNYLGRSLIYIDTSFRTPMNRARTEAMFSGCCVVQVEGAHDIERWGRDGENIILVPNQPDEIARILVSLLEENYQKAIEVGQRGKAFAIEQLNPERYRRDWLALFDSVVPPRS